MCSDMTNVSLKNRAMKKVAIADLQDQLNFPKTCGERVYKVIGKKRLRTGQIYELLPEFNPRTIREALMRLKVRKLIKKETCECGQDTLWCLT